MLRKLITVVAVVTLTIAGFGCKKKPAQPATPNQPAAAPKVEVKSQAEYNEMAKKQITKDNMQAELDKVGKEVQQENLR